MRAFAPNKSRKRRIRALELPPKQKHHQLPLPQKLQTFLTYYDNCLRHAFNVGVQHNKTRPRLSPPTKLYRNTRCTLNCVPRILAARRAETSPKATSCSALMGDLCLSKPNIYFSSVAFCVFGVLVLADTERTYGCRATGTGTGEHQKVKNDKQ